MSRTPGRQPSMQTRLMLLVIGFASAVWLGAALLSWFDAQHEIDELLDSHLAQAAALLQLQADADFDDISDTPVLQKYAPHVAFQVYRGEHLVTRSANAGTTPLSNQGEGFATVRRADGVLWRVVRTDGGRHGVSVLVGEQVAARQSILWAMVRGMVGPLLLAVPLFGLGLWWAVRKGLAPLRALRARLEQRAPYAAVPVSLDGMPPELQPMVRTLNGLLERMDSMVQSERRFTADAAHELRTPIAAIRVQAQVALGAQGDTVQRTHALRTSLAACDRASHLVDQLLLLARLDATPPDTPQAMAAEVQKADLGAVVHRVVAELEPAAGRRQQVLEIAQEGASPRCQVVANEALLGVLVRNLVDNALRYSPPGAQVQVRVVQDAQCCVLEVQDSGPGMGQADIAHLGERFFRVLGSGQTGSGLGWSIVRRLLAVFGASVHIGRSARLGGLAVTVRWPRP